MGDGKTLSLHGGETEILVEDVLLGVASEGQPRVVVLFRDLARPACLFRMRMEAVDPAGRLGSTSAEAWAGVILANLTEAIEGGPGLAACDPNRITDVQHPGVGASGEQHDGHDPQQVAGRDAEDG